MPDVDLQGDLGSGSGESGSGESSSGESGSGGGGGGSGGGSSGSGNSNCYAVTRGERLPPPVLATTGAANEVGPAGVAGTSIRIRGQADCDPVERRRLRERGGPWVTVYQGHCGGFSRHETLAVPSRRHLRASGYSLLSRQEAVLLLTLASRRLHGRSRSENRQRTHVIPNYNLARGSRLLEDMAARPSVHAALGTLQL